MKQVFDWTGLETLYSAGETRELDRHAMEGFGISGTTLMARAATVAFDHLLAAWPQPSLLQVFCGTGNNGGDGFLLADLAHKRGIPVVVWQLGDPTRIRGSAALARDQALAHGVAVEAWRPGALRPEGVLVDAMLGTGLRGEVGSPWREVIASCNDSGLPILAVDIPSGLCADTGRRLGTSIRADLTVTFIGLKRGLFTLDGPDCRGTLEFSDLAVPAGVYQRLPVSCRRLDLEQLLVQFPARPANSHKGRYGTVLIVGGDYGLGGAVALAAEAALRAGAGLVRVATRPEHVSAIIARTPEAMPVGVESGQALRPLLETADVLVVGPGLGQGPWAQQLLQVIATADQPCVLDADGLNLLSRGQVLPLQPRSGWVFTPHPGEAARLLDSSTAAVQADRFAAVAALQQRLGGTVLLKGNGSLVSDGERCLLSDYGNPGMASGGMGDVLSGLIGALLAQGLGGLEATALAASLHGAAADAAAAQGQRGLLASDLMPELRRLLG